MSRRGSETSVLSIVAPAYNEEESLESLYRRVADVMDAEGMPFELVIVDNGSSDRTLEILKRLNRQDSRVHYLSLSRNFGHQGGLIAGLEHATGDVVVSMDADLQHPPEVIPQMLTLWRQGVDVVFTIKRDIRGQSILRRAFNWAFYGVMSRLSRLELRGGQSDFRLMDRAAVDALCSLRERNKFLRGLSRWIGFRQEGVQYDVGERFAGRSKFRIGHLFRFALDGILSFSVVPLRLFTFFGFVTALPAFLYGLFALGSGAYAFFTGYHGRVPPGWASVAAAVFFLGGVQLMGIGLLGEYVGRIYDEVKGRPQYLVRESSMVVSGENARDASIE